MPVPWYRGPMAPVSNRAKRENSPADTLRVLVLGVAFLVVAGLGGLVIAVVAGSASGWALAGFGLVIGSLMAWRARAQAEVVRRSSPDQALTRGELARYGGVAVAVALLVVAVAGVAAAIS